MVILCVHLNPDDARVSIYLYVQENTFPPNGSTVLLEANHVFLPRMYFLQRQQFLIIEAESKGALHAPNFPTLLDGRIAPKVE